MVHFATEWVYRHDWSMTEQTAEIYIVAYLHAHNWDIRTAVVFWLTIPMAASSAMTPEMVVAGVSPGMAIISKPTEQTQVIASSFSMVSAPASTALIMPWSSLTGMKAPLKPPT